MEACVSGVLLSIITPSGRVQRALTMEYITLVDPNRKDKVLRYLSLSEACDWAWCAIGTRPH
jgi:hypothetical protein